MVLGVLVVFDRLGKVVFLSGDAFMHQVAEADGDRIVIQFLAVAVDVFVGCPPPALQPRVGGCGAQAG